MSETWIQVLTIVGANLVIMLTFFGVSISLYLNTDRTINAIKNDMNEFKALMAKENQEFHGRLCDIEARRGK